MDTPTGAAANLLSRVWWPLPADKLDAFEVMRLFADVVEDGDITAMFGRALENPEFKSSINQSERSTALALLRLSGSDGSYDSSAAENEITSALVSAASSISMSSSEGSFLQSAIKNFITVVGSCLRQWAKANSHSHVMKTESLQAHAAKQFYIKHFVEYSDTSAAKQVIEDAPRLDQVMSIMKGSKCSFMKCNRMARLPSSFCTYHGDSIKKCGGTRKDVPGEHESVVHQRKRNLALVSTAAVRKLINASTRRLASFRRGKATSVIKVSKQGRQAVYSQLAAEKISEKHEELKEYRVHRVEYVPPPRLWSSTPASFKRLGESLRREDPKVFTPAVRSTMPWFRIHWKMDEESERLAARDSDDSDFEPSQTPRKTEDIFGTGRLLDCPEAMTDGIVRKLTKRSRGETFMKTPDGGTDRVSRHTGKWPRDARDAVRELLSALRIIDPVATCRDLKEDNPDGDFSPQAHGEITNATIKVCVDMIAYLDMHQSDKSQLDTDQMANEALTLLDAIASMRRVPRWTAVGEFNIHLVHDALASLFAAVCTVTRRWASMPKYIAIDTSNKDHEDIIWRLSNECRSFTLRLLGFAANDASIALDRFPGYAEYVPQEIQTTVALGVYNWLLSSSLDPTIIVQTSNEPVTNDEDHDGEPDKGNRLFDPTKPGAVEGITRVDNDTPVVEVARWEDCLDQLGYGVRAKSSIPNGAVIATVNFRVRHPSKRESSFALLDPDGVTRCIDDRSLARWINGSDFLGATGRPNVFIHFKSMAVENPTIAVIASRDIDIGEEVTMNYGNSFKTPAASENAKGGIPDRVVRCLDADDAMKDFRRLTGINPAWSEQGITSFITTGSSWAARRWAEVETKLLRPEQRSKAGFYSSNDSADAYYSALGQLAIDLPPELKFSARDEAGNKLAHLGASQPRATDFFEVDSRGNVKGLKDDFDMYPYGATLLTYHGLRETRKIVIGVEGSKRKSRSLQGVHFNDAAWEQQEGKKRIRATLTDAHIRPLTKNTDSTTQALHEHSLLLRADVCTSIQENHPVGPCVLRKYWDPSQGDPDKLIPTQQTLQGMNSCTLFATFNHTYEGVWHIEPDSAVSLNENIGMHDGFVIIVSDQTAVLKLCKLHLFMEMAAPGGVDLSSMRRGNTKHGAIQNAHRGLPWLSRPPHPDLLSALGIDTATFKVYRQKPGETIFIPGGALHAVVHKSPSVRVACGFVSTEDACRTVIRSALGQNEGSKSTLWSVVESVNKGDVDVGAALLNIAEDHRENKASKRWSRVNMPELCRLVMECADTLFNTNAMAGVTGASRSKKKKIEPERLRRAKMSVPLKCQVAGRTGPTFMVTPNKLIAAKNYFQQLISPERRDQTLVSRRHRGEKCDVGGKHPDNARTNEPHERTMRDDGDGIMQVSSPQRSKNALSRQGKRSQFTALHKWDLLRNVVQAELTGLTDAQFNKLKTSLDPSRFGQERALQVELALMETACNELLEGKLKVVFQHPAHQSFCHMAMDEKIGTTEDVQQALQTPPVRDIPGQGLAVHVFTINIGDNTQGRPDHFASVVCRTDSTVACFLDSAASCAPISRTQAIEDLRSCLCAAHFFQTKGQIQMMHAQVSEQDIAKRDYTCMERALLNAAYVVCFEEKPYDNVSFEMDMGKYTRLSEIFGDLLNEIRRNEQSEEAPPDLRSELTEDATKSAVDAVVALLKSMAPTKPKRTSPRKTRKTD